MEVSREVDLLTVSAAPSCFFFVPCMMKFSVTVREGSWHPIPPPAAAVRPQGSSSGTSESNSGIFYIIGAIGGGVIGVSLAPAFGMAALSIGMFSALAGGAAGHLLEEKLIKG